MAERRDRVVRLGHLRLTLGRRTAILMIDHPPMNLLSWDGFEDLERAGALLEREQPGCVVITGCGRSFCTGVDIGGLPERDCGPNPIAEARVLREGAGRWSASVQALTRARRPFIAAINGLCAGGGLEIALACHLRFGSRYARFAFPEISYGFFPGAGGTQLAPRLIGASRAFELLLTGSVLSADEATRWGVLNRVVPAAELLAEAIRYAERIADMPAAAVRACIEAVEEGTPS